MVSMIFDPTEEGKTNELQVLICEAVPQVGVTHEAVFSPDVLGSWELVHLLEVSMSYG